MDTGKQDQLLRLFKDTEPLKKRLAYEADLSHLGFSYDDIMGFMDDKIIHVWMKYSDKPYEEIKALALSSLRHVVPRLTRKYREVLLPEDTDIPLEVEEHPSMEVLLESLKSLLDSSSYAFAEVVLDPPRWVLSQTTEGKRIPSRLFLEFLDKPVNKQSIKQFNTFRRDLLEFIRKTINPETLQPFTWA